MCKWTFWDLEPHGAWELIVAQGARINSNTYQDRRSNGDCSFALSRRYAIHKFVETSVRILIFPKIVYASFTYLKQIKFVKSKKGASYANALWQNLYFFKGYILSRVHHDCDVFSPRCIFRKILCGECLTTYPIIQRSREYVSALHFTTSISSDIWHLDHCIFDHNTMTHFGCLTSFYSVYTTAKST